MSVEICKNCECTIGKFEQAYVLHGEVVCQNCYQRLTNADRVAVVKKYRVIKICITLTLLSTMYIAWPYISIYHLYSAIKDENPREISAHIDFPSFRISLKEQINASMMKEMAKDPKMADNPFSGLALALLPKMVESVVDAYVTPAGVATMFEIKSTKEGSDVTKKHTAQDEDDAYNKPLKEIRYAFFANPTSFLLKIEDVYFTFRIRDWTWKITDVKLSEEEIVEMKSSKEDI